MGRCSVLGCRMKFNKKHPNTTLHRLPTCKKRQKQWLDILRIENLNTTTKTIFICSLHFEEKCFNRTLNVTRLRDDALPSSELLLPVQLEDCEEQQSVSCRVLEEKPISSTSKYAELPAHFKECEEQQFVSHKALEEKTVCSTSSYANLPTSFNECEEQQFDSHKALNEKPVCSTSSYADLPGQFNECEKQQSVPRKVFEEQMPVCSTSNYSQDKALEMIQKLKTKCEQQKKKIKRLNEKVRRQSKKIADFRTVTYEILKRTKLCQ